MNYSDTESWSAITTVQSTSGSSFKDIKPSKGIALGGGSRGKLYFGYKEKDLMVTSYASGENWTNPGNQGAKIDAIPTMGSFEDTLYLFWKNNGSKGKGCPCGQPFLCFNGNDQ